MLVERAFLINLTIRPDRLREFRARYPSPSCFPQVEVWPAIHGDTCQPPDNWTAGNGAWGCYKAHLNILEYCLNNRVGSYVVFEDDAQFQPFFSDYMPTVFTALPDDWQQFYLGGQLLHHHRNPPVRVNEHIYRPFNVNRTHCFCVSADGMLPIYRHITNLPFHGGEHIDHHLGRLHETGRFNVYTTAQMSVGQGGTSSNISGKTDEITYYENPEQFALSHWLYSKPACVVLRGSPGLSRQLEDRLHFGNWRDNGGYDRGLTLASKFAYPGPEISKWYQLVRAEVVREDKGRIPCVFHPRLTDEMLSMASLGNVLYLNEPTLEEAQRAIDELRGKHATT